MTEKERALWEAICRFSFEETIEEYGFETRLAYENKWTHYVTKKAIEEYKKFIFLASISNQMVSPSEIVDIVWHQHLIFSKSYEKLCQIAGKKIEHIPSTHNPHNHSVFKAAQEHTTTLYESYFGRQNHYFWDNSCLNEIQLVPKSNVLRKRMMTMAVVSVLVYFPLYFFLRPYIIVVESPTFIFYTVLMQCFLFSFLYFQVDSVADNKATEWYNTDIHTQNLNAAEVLCLKTGSNNRYVHAAVDNMIRKKKLSIVGNWGVKFQLDSKLVSIDETAVWNSLTGNETESYAKLFQQLKRKEFFQIPLQVMENFMKNMRNSKFFVNAFSVLVLLLLPLFYILLIRLQLGVQRDKPVTFLLMEIGFYVFAGYYFLKKAYNRPFVKAIPELYNNKIKSEERTDLKQSWEWEYLLLGTAFYNDAFRPLMNPVEIKEKSNSSGGSCGSSCSSSCGSSCGGCGGGD